jgi:hypothetical protein
MTVIVDGISGITFNNNSVQGYSAVAAGLSGTASITGSINILYE